MSIVIAPFEHRSAEFVLVVRAGAAKPLAADATVATTEAISFTLEAVSSVNVFEIVVGILVLRK